MQHILKKAGFCLVTHLFVLSVGSVAVAGQVVATPAVGLEALRDAIAQASSLDAPVTNLPSTKKVAISVEGEPQEITVRLYNDPAVPIVTYYPQALEVSGACDEDGCGVSFVSETLNASLFLLFPSNATTIAAVEPYLTGDSGLFTESEWTITATSTNEADLPFSWVKKKVNFQAPNAEATGVAYFGEHEGRAFAAVEVFPPDAGDGFAPQVGVILSEMRLR